MNTSMHLSKMSVLITCDIHIHVPCQHVCIHTRKYTYKNTHAKTYHISRVYPIYARMHVYNLSLHTHIKVPCNHKSWTVYMYAYLHAHTRIYTCTYTLIYTHERTQTYTQVSSSWFCIMHIV